MTEDDAARRRSRRILLLTLAAAVAAVAVPTLIVRWLERDACPMTVEHQGTSDGARWYTTIADCGGGRMPRQLWLVPPKGVATVVYEAEGGPAPVEWTQSGFTGRLTLAAPLAGENAATLDVALDPKGRPLAPIRVRDAHRLP